MDLLELQQRANILVEKVNEFEANLAGTEIDESTVIDEHVYADLHCLRAVIKLLFGATLEDKLNRTTLNDTDIKIYSSQAPAWNTKFDFYSYYPEGKPYKVYKTWGNPNIINQTLIADGENFVVFYELNPVDNWNTPGGINEGQYVKFHIKSKIQDLAARNLATLRSGYNNANRMALYGSWNDSSNTELRLKFGYQNNITQIYVNDIIECDIYCYATEAQIQAAKDSRAIDLTGALTNLSINGNNIPGTWYDTGGAFGKDQSIATEYGSTDIQLAIKPISDLPNVYTYLAYLDDMSVTTKSDNTDIGYVSNSRLMVQNIDMLNDYNMLQLDVQQYGSTTREQRIADGVNYSYSANIQDALVTESQVANVFKWNTTSEVQIANNVKTNNRQVPGIVVYYLGQYYDGTYTATIPYASDVSNINSVNNKTPAYYGAYYDNTDIEDSQVIEFRDTIDDAAECCKIFMTGCTYTRGQLTSPQQIWQPEERLGTSNIGYGYNWQGQALYHELVFKNRRTGTKALGLDFIPAVESVPDNDPQGLATRFALAQQKPYYYNRPFFKELDSLVGLNASKLVDYINANSKYTPENVEPETPVDPVTTTTINWSDFEVVGSPTITDDYVVSSISTTNYIKVNRQISLGKEFEFHTRLNPDTLSYARVLDTLEGAYLYIGRRTDGKLEYGIGDGSNYIEVVSGVNTAMQVGYWTEIKVNLKDGLYTFDISRDNGETWQRDYQIASDLVMDNITPIFGLSRNLSTGPFNGRMALGPNNTYFNITTDTRETEHTLSDMILVNGTPTITNTGLVFGTNDNNFVYFNNTVAEYFDVGSEWQLTFLTPPQLRTNPVNTYVYGAPWYTSIWINYDSSNNRHILFAQDWGQTTNNAYELITNIQPATWYTIKFKKTQNQLIEYYYNDQLLATSTPGNVGATSMSYCRLGKIGSTGVCFNGIYDLTKSYVKLSNATEPTYLATYEVIEPETPDVPEPIRPEFDRTLFNVIGTVTLTDDGILTDTNSENYITTLPIEFNGAKNIEILSPIFSRISVASKDNNLFTIQTEDQSETNAISVSFKGDYNNQELAYEVVYGNQVITGGTVTVLQEYNTVQYRIVSEQVLDNLATYIVYYRFDSGEWQTLTNFQKGSLSHIWNCTIGQVPDGTTYEYIDVSPMKITTDIGLNVVFEASRIAQVQMNDEAFYKYYKLDYNTFAEALDQPL